MHWYKQNELIRCVVKPVAHFSTKLEVNESSFMKHFGSENSC